MAARKRRNQKPQGQFRPRKTSPPQPEPDTPPTPFQFREPRQQRVYDRLFNLVAPGPARFWRDACAIMEGEIGIALDSTSHIVGHLLREIESAIRDVLEELVPSSPQPSTGSKKQAGKGHLQEISAILAALDVDPEQEPWAKAWLSVGEEKSKFKLHQVAHRQSLDLPRPVGPEFKKFWDEMGGVFDVVLDRFEAKYLKVFESLDKLREKPIPPKEDLEKLRDHLPNNYVARSYFFEKLDQPAWLLPLKGYGFFDHPREKEYDPENDRWVSPVWPQTSYLARMAEKDPQTVHDIAVDIPDTDNASINSDLAEAAMAKAMPPALAADLTPRVLAWVESSSALIDPKKVGAFIGYLAEGAQAQAALRIARSFLAVAPHRRAITAAVQGTTLYLPPGPQIRIGEAEYEEVVRLSVPALVRADGMGTMEWLCELLDDAISLSQRPSAEDAWDMSPTWRPAIDSDAGFVSYAIPNLLVSTIRDAAVQIATLHPRQVRPVVDLLEKRHRHVFHRLALHILRIVPGSAKDLITARLTEHDRFSTEELWRETGLLMREHFANLSPGDQAKILSWIDEGPHFESVDASEEGSLIVSAPTNDEKAHLTKEWQLQRLEPIHNLLPPEWRDRYDELVSELGEPRQFESPTMGMGETTWVGPTSEISADALRSSSVEVIIERLRNRPPSGPPMGHSPEGLARELSPVVAADPERFATQSNLFRGVDPTYVRGVLMGLSEAVKQKRPFSWQPVLSFCQWIVAQPRELPGRLSEHPDLDTGWGWTRKTIAELMSTGLAEGPMEIPFGLRQACWDILLSLTEDPEPTLEDETRHEGMDPATLSINTTRGQAMHAVVRYALWIRRHLSNRAKAGDRALIGFGDMQEVREVLDRHLDPALEPTLSIRSIYGWWFVSLTWLDSDWARTRASSVFPKDSQWRRLRDAAWDAYITFTNPYRPAFELLRGEYRHYAGQIDQVDTNRMRALPTSPAARLCEHLMILYSQGLITLADHDRILNLFFEKAGGELRGHAIESVGRWLREPAPVPTEVLDRLKDLWTWRTHEARNAPVPAAHATELAAFGWWFASGKFDDHWALAQMEAVLGLVGRIEPEGSVLARLADLSADMMSEVLNALELIIRGDARGWVVLTRREPIRTILTKALQSPDPISRRATELINRLSARGHHVFSDLLSPSEGTSSGPKPPDATRKQS